MITPAFNLTATERVLPRLALDFTTAVLDARITFTRSGNTATVVNSSGNVVGINADLPRFDFNPVTLVCRGLLIEEARTNLITSSEDITAWTNLNSTDASDVAVAPSGATTADKIITNSAASNGQVFFTVNKAASAITYTYSVFAKKAEWNRIGLFLSDSVTFANRADFTVDLENGTVVSAATARGTFTAASGRVQAYRDGWYRVSLTFTSGTETAILYRNYSLDSVATTGDGTSGIYWFGAQLETGAFPTSYIPTSGGTATRNADVAVMTGTNFSDWFNASEGTFVVSGQKGGSTFTPFYTAHDGTNSNKIETDFDAAAHLIVVAGGATQANIDAGTVSANTLTKLAAAYKVNSFAACISGGSVATDTSGTIPIVDRLQIGGAFNAIPYGTKTIATLSYYPMRLTNAEVQAFSK